MTMEAGAEAQQGADTAVAETEAQQITQAQIATLTQVTMSTGSLLTNPCDHTCLVTYRYQDVEQSTWVRATTHHVNAADGISSGVASLTKTKL